MTLVSQIISDSYRQSNLLAIGDSPTSAQETEALRYLNRIVKSVFGNEAGEQLQTFPLGDNGVNRPAGWPWWGNSPPADWFVPKNQRLVLNLTENTTVYLHPNPNAGSRVAVVDISNNLATYNLTINGNGRNIEGASSITLNTSGEEKEWFYREDLGDWVLYSELTLTDQFPFPVEFEDYFISLLAMRLNPAYGASMDPQSVETMRRAKTQLKSRYSQTIEARSEEGLLRTLGVGTGWTQDFDDSTALFNRGIAW